MFQRAHGDAYEGFGIGLAMCRKIVEAHGGAISATPAPVGGTTIHFSLPAVASTMPQPLPTTGGEHDAGLGGMGSAPGASRVTQRPS
jgi:hypothetical protein